MKFVSRFLPSVFFLIGNCNMIFGQDSDAPKAEDIIDVTKVMAPSPTAAALAKYVEWPVDLSTGVPNIEIPLYELKGRTLSMPISISYHSSGIKVNEIASWVGLGWSLKAGGVITRAVRGLPDDCGSGYFAVRDLLHNHNYTYATDPDSIDDTLWKGIVLNVASGDQEAVQDQYYLNALGRSYRLLFKDTGSGYEIQTIPYSNIIVETDPDAWNTNSGSWKVTLEDGTVMLFGNPTSGTDKYVESSNTSHPNTCGGSWASSWYLRSVISAKQEQIYFKYVQQDTTGQLVSSFSFGDSYKVPQGLGSPVYASKHTTIDLQNYKTLTLDSIVSELGFVKFGLSSSDRLDFPNAKSLATMSVYSKVNGITTLVDSYHFITRQVLTDNTSGLDNPVSYPDGYMNYRMMLDTVVRYGSGSATNRPRWIFTYNSTLLPSTLSFSQDHYGYFNHKTNSDLLPAASVPPSYTFPGAANRDVDATYTQASILTAITYPTGGRSKFSYEGNGSVGGVRIRSIIDIDGIDTTKNIKRFFEYAKQQTNFGLGYLQYTAQTQEVMNSNFTGTTTFRTSQTFSPLGQVGSMAGYGRVTTNYGPAAENGKTVSYFTTNPDDFFGTSDGRPNYDSDPREHLRGLLIREEIYGQDGKLRKTTHNTYSFAVKTTLTFFKAWRFSYTTDPNVCMTPPEICGYTTIPGYLTNHHVKKLSTRETDYTWNGTSYDSASVLSSYTYSTGVNAKPIETDINDSQGNTLKIFVRTVYENSSMSPDNQDNSGVVGTMTDLNMVDIPLQKAQSLNSSNLITTTTQYTVIDTTPDVVMPTSIETRVGTASAGETRLTYSYSSDGKYNLVEQYKADDVHHSFIYDYNLCYPIAEAVNAQESQIAYTSFEADGKGKWTYNKAAVNIYDSWTGANSFTVSSTNKVTRTSLPSGSYNVSFWAKSGSFTVNGSAVVASYTRSGWTYYETITGSVTSVEISGSGIIDEVRLYPSGAQMSTATYIPLVGKSSETDVANDTIYYEYDTFNRLVAVRDDKGNLLKTINYHYKSTPY